MDHQYRRPESSRICAILLQDLMKRGICWCGGGDALRCVMPGEMLLFLYVLTFSSKESISPFYSYMFPCYHLKRFIKCVELGSCTCGFSLRFKNTLGLRPSGGQASGEPTRTRTSPNPNDTYQGSNLFKV
jgi:hypothetical protein